MFVDIDVVNDTSDIPRHVCNNTHSQQALQESSICISDGYHDYILVKTVHQDQVVY